MSLNVNMTVIKKIFFVCGAFCLAVAIFQQTPLAFFFIPADYFAEKGVQRVVAEIEAHGMANFQHSYQCAILWLLAEIADRVTAKPPGK